MSKAARTWILSAAILTVPALATAWGQADDPYTQALSFTFGADRSPLDAVEAEIREAGPDRYHEIEEKLLKLLAAPEATFECKQFACRMLRLVGSEASIPALERLLYDKDLSHMARFALERMRSPAVDPVLRKAVVGLDGDLLIGVINSIGDRGDGEAVSALAGLVNRDDRKLAEASIRALGLIGGAEAAEVLTRAKVPRDLEAVRSDALLECADGMASAGSKVQALRIYRKLSRANEPDLVRVAAFRGMVQADPDRAVKTALLMLNDKSQAVQEAAGQLIPEIETSGATRAFSTRIRRLPPGARVILINALAVRGDRAAAADVAVAVGSRDSSVSIAAIRALASLGGVSDVELLVHSVSLGDEAAAAAYATLERLKGDAVGEAVTKCMEGVEPPVQVGLMRVLVARQDAGSVPALLRSTADPDTSVRLEALKALARLAGEPVLSSVLDLVVSAPSEKDRKAAAEAALAIAGRIPDADRRAAAVLARLNTASEIPVRCSFLGILGGLAITQGLPALRAALADPEPEIRKQAIRALADWPDPTPVDDLRVAAESAPYLSEHVLAMRGYARQLTLPSDRPADETAAMYAEGLGLARQDDEKRLLLSGLGDVRHPEALKVARAYLADAGLKAEAQAAVDKILSFLNAPHQVTASHNRKEASNAVDGDPESRWGSGRPMANGMWFEVDFGYDREIRGLKLDTTPSGQDYPRGYEVYVSGNKDDWGAPVAQGTGSNAVVDIDFEPVKARYLRIVQTGTDGFYWWSIHELTVKFDLSTEEEW